MSTPNEKHIGNEPSDEDIVQCFIFAPPLNSDQSAWNHLCNEINNTIKSLSQDYLWHRDALKLFLPVYEKTLQDFPPHLTSRTCFGDNIEDEWFIVHIILELTKQYKDLIVQLQDNDGDFLLIEAADHLPQWANPETTENRVSVLLLLYHKWIFIHKNHIHLIPPNLASLDYKLSLNDATHIISQSSNLTQVSVRMERAILDRIGDYPKKIKENIHNATVKVPLEIAVLLKLKPNMIAPIVETYCHHDAIDAKTFRNIHCENWVTITAKFTKCLYAMLLYSKLANSIRQPIENDKKTILGLKLACGLQMIMKRSSDIFSSKEYIKFLNSLNENGYFNNNIEGSKEYKEKLKNAQDFFSAVECPITSNVSHEIEQVMTTDEYMKTKELLLTENVSLSNDIEDNDDWLTLHPEQLNELLNSRYGKKTKFQKGDVLTPENVTTELENFLNRTSDFEGIETNDADGFENNKIDFNPAEFEDCIEKMLKLLTSDNDDEIESTDSDFSEDNMSLSDEENYIDKELKEKLHGAAENLGDKDTILNNMIKSMKEEKASAGPSSNLISNVGLRKADFLDSDDEEE